MSKCSLRITLDRGQYSGGDSISGNVLVNVNKNVHCDGLILTLGWRAHGRGNRYVEVDQEVLLFQGPWNRGQTAAYAFELTLPQGPHTWHGEIVNVDWYLHATADIPWAIDPKDELDFVVERGSEPSEPPSLPLPMRDPRLNPLTTLIPTIAALLIPAMGLLFVFIGLIAMLFGQFHVAPFGLFGFFIGAFGLWNGRSQLGNLLSRRKLGDVSLSVSPNVAAPGEAIQASLSLTAKKDVKIEEIKISFILRESATSGSGTDRKTYTYEHLMEDDIVLQEHRLDVDQTFTTDLTLTIPADAPSSFSATNNQLVWVVRADVDMPGWVDLYEETYLIVR